MKKADSRPGVRRTGAGTWLLDWPHGTSPARHSAGTAAHWASSLQALAVSRYQWDADCYPHIAITQMQITYVIYLRRRTDARSEQPHGQAPQARGRTTALPRSGPPDNR